MKVIKYFYTEPLFMVKESTIVNRYGDEYYRQITKDVLTEFPRLTVCGIFDSETMKMNIGIAKCSSEDKFVKKIGREIAQDKAENNPTIILSISPEESIHDIFMDHAIMIEHTHIISNGKYYF